MISDQVASVDFRKGLRALVSQLMRTEMMATKYLTVDQEISPLKIFVGAMEQQK